MDKISAENKIEPMSLNDFRSDPFCLDAFNFKDLKFRPRVIVTNEPFQAILADVPVVYFPPVNFGLLRSIPFINGILNCINSAAVAFRMLKEMKKGEAVGLIDFGKHSGSFFCLLNSFKPFKSGPVIAHRVLLSAEMNPVANYLVNRALCSADLISVWSRSQIDNYSRTLGCPREKFFFMPYKANHSKSSSIPMPVGDYIFSGGDSERDFKTFFEAVRDLPIPVVVSTRNSRKLARKMEIPKNVILLSAEEPYYERLMTGSRMVALCLKPEIIRGSGEATILNAMWHGKPVVIADNVSSSEYIKDGIGGYVVPAGNVAEMRRRINELWNDPARLAQAGESGRELVHRLYTHNQFKARMQTLAMLVYESRLKTTS